MFFVLLFMFLGVIAILSLFIDIFGDVGMLIGVIFIGLVMYLITKSSSGKK